MVVDLLHALHRPPGLRLHREGGRLGLSPQPPEKARAVFARHKGALLRGLVEGEVLEASQLLASPFRLGALLAHALGVEGPLVLTLYAGERDPRRYLVPALGVTPHLAWASQNLPPPWRLHLSPTTGDWALDLREGWKVGVEALAGRTRYLLLLPHLEARAWLEAAHKGLVPPEELGVWRRGETSFTARGWGEALAHLEEVAHAR